MKQQNIIELPLPYPSPANDQYIPIVMSDESQTAIQHLIDQLRGPGSISINGHYCRSRSSSD